MTWWLRVFRRNFGLVEVDAQPAEVPSAETAAGLAIPELARAATSASFREVIAGQAWWCNATTADDGYQWRMSEPGALAYSASNCEISRTKSSRMR
jgi:hypothetical protein